MKISLIPSIRTLTFILKNKQVLLGKRKGSQLGKNLWVGIGGKVDSGESILESAKREIEEETTLIVKKRDLIPMGKVEFIFPFKPEWTQRVFIFITNKFKGRPKEIEKIIPRWFDKNKLPFNKMWADAPFWIPTVLNRKKINARFTFAKDNRNIQKIALEILY